MNSIRLGVLEVEEKQFTLLGRIISIFTLNYYYKSKPMKWKMEGGKVCAQEASAHDTLHSA